MNYKYPEHRVIALLLMVPAGFLVVKTLLAVYRFVWRHAELLFDILATIAVVGILLVLAIFLVPELRQLYFNFRYGPGIYQLLDSQIAETEQALERVSYRARELSFHIKRLQHRIRNIPENRRIFHRNVNAGMVYLNQLQEVFETFRKFLATRLRELEQAKLQIDIVQDMEALVHAFEGELGEWLDLYPAFSGELEAFLEQELERQLKSQRTARISALRGYGSLSLPSFPFRFDALRYPGTVPSIVEEIFQESYYLLDKLELQARALETLRQSGGSERGSS